MRWLAQIGHPLAKDLEAFNHEAAFAGRLGDLIRTQQNKHERARERDRRYRQRKKFSAKKASVGDSLG